MNKTTFHISKMDCAAEEQLVRMKLQGLPSISSLQFNLPERKVEIYHSGELEAITQAIDELKLNSALNKTEEVVHVPVPSNEAGEKKLLIIVLLINSSLFLIEIITGFIANSMGLVADSLDMLADAFVYSLSLYAIGKAITRKKRVAQLSGYLQMLLAILGMVEVIRRFFGFGDTPAFEYMIFISLLALTGNLTSLLLLRKTQSTEAHIRASQIFTSNDVLANIGVIIAGLIVFFTHSRLPDLIVGTIIFFIVANGARRILKLSK